MQLKCVRLPVRAFVTCCAVGICFWLCLAVGRAGAETCANEATRIGPAAALGECRAFEQVTPVDKEGGTGVYSKGVVQVGPDGEGVAFVSPSAYADAEGNTLNNRYVSRRSDSGWSTNLIDGPQSIQEGNLVRATLAVSPDLGLALIASRSALAPGAIPEGSNLYLRDLADGTWTLIAAQAGNAFFNEMTTVGGAVFVGASSDWSVLLLKSRQVLIPGAVQKKSNLYEFRREGSSLSLVAPNVEPAAAASTAKTPNVLSADGRRFFYSEGLSASTSKLFLHQDGAAAIPISESERTGDPPGTVAQAIFYGATPDGSTVFFTSSSRLTDASVSTTQTRDYSRLYRYELNAPAGERLTDLTPNAVLTSEVGPDVKSVSGLSADGTYVYFAASGSLTPDAPPAIGGFSVNFYVWHGEPGQGGTLRYISQTPTDGRENSKPAASLASENGQFLAIASYSSLTPDATGSPNCPQPSASIPAGACENVFSYSYATDVLTCVSCSAEVLGNSALGGASSLIETPNYVPRAALDDGTVYFDSPNRLVPRDANGVEDVYSWRGGEYQLLSGGISPSPSTFGDATIDGHDVFIRTSQQLVSQDEDQSLDLYDVRVDGGIGAQNPSPPSGPCEGEACRGPLIAQPAPPPAASSVLHGNGNEAGRCALIQKKAKAFGRRAAASARRARRATGHRASVLRRAAKRQKKAARRSRAHAVVCEGEIR